MQQKWIKPECAINSNKNVLSLLQMFEFVATQKIERKQSTQEKESEGDDIVYDQGDVPFTSFLIQKSIIRNMYVICIILICDVFIF